MIRRAFWLGAGAAAGIMGYRRVSALGRRLVPSTVSTQSSPAIRQRHAIRGTIRFARDVRAGMDIYTSRHSVSDALPSGNDRSSGSTTSDSSASDRHDRKDGR